MIDKMQLVLELFNAGDLENARIIVEGYSKEIDKIKAVESRSKGKWISVDWANEYFDCSICSNRRRGTPRYCEDCGAEMQEVERVKGLSERIVIKNDRWLNAEMRGKE